MAIYNEEKFLPYSLPNIVDPVFNELVFVFDRCTDKSEELVKGFMDERFVIFHKDKQEWVNPCAESKSVGVSLANKELLMISDADVILDIDSVKKAIKLFEKDIDAVVFSYNQYSLSGTIFNRIKDEWINLLWRFIRKSKFQPTRSGIYMIKKEMAIIPDLTGEYDHLQQTLRTFPINTKTIHLRPRRSKKTQIQRGRVRSNLPQYTAFKTLITSLLLLEPHTFVGFLMGR
jgi:cellulose synthase/poly-beta-1,6-N-acetylglucosamine synthase-like glycosyltransferase